jgi:hypothetical protein
MATKETVVREHMIGRLISAIEGGLLDSTDGGIDEDKLLELVEENCKLLIEELNKES